MFYITTLTIAGSDCSGGAGIQADIKTMSALGCYAASAITSVTVQNTRGVYDIFNVPPTIISGQIKAVMEDIKPAAVKIGMVNDIESVKAIVQTLRNYRIRHLIIDPVMVATSGDRLMNSDTVDLFCSELIPTATLLTPNLPEAEVLADMTIGGPEGMTAAAKKILALGCRHVLIKGGHAAGDVKTDVLYTMTNVGVESHAFSSASVHTKNTHGTGCSLSSAITAFMARGLEVTEAVAEAKHYVSEALRAGAEVTIGEGHGPMDHFYAPESLIIRER